ncbi:MAG: tetratricopeptide repeat protein [Lachnospiraceae bacterium]|nr:tetratricopeptide repeat protein [Lachnospiraceae bacterium]
MSLRKNKKWIVLAGSVLVAGVLAGCGTSGEKIDNATQLLEQLNYEAALAEFDLAEEAGENERLIARGRGIAYMGLTDYDNAIANFEASLGASDGFVQNVDFDVNYYLAAAYFKSGQSLEAEEAYNAILALRPDEEDAYFLRGNVRLERGNYEGAKEDFDKVVSMDSNNYDRLIEIYRALEHYGYKAVGQEYLNNAMKAAGDKMDSYDSGRMYYYLEDYQKACVALEKARSKGDAESFLYLGKSYEATGDYNYAASVYNSWIAKDTGSAAIYNQLGLCEMQMGSYKRALDAFQAGKKVEGNSLMQTLSFNEIVAYEYLGEYTQASVLLDSYLKTYPDDEVAKREKQFLATR